MHRLSQTPAFRIDRLCGDRYDVMETPRNKSFGGGFLPSGRCLTRVMTDEMAIRARYHTLRSGLDERGRRLFAAAESLAAGFGPARYGT